MKIHARLFLTAGEGAIDTVFEFDAEKFGDTPDSAAAPPPRFLHMGGMVFEVHGFVSIPVGDARRIDADYRQRTIFSAELERDLVALVDEEEVHEIQERALAQATREHAPLFAETLARYIGGAKDEALDYRLIAEQAFNAYNEHGSTPWLTFDGRPVPRWDAITDAVREKWIAAVKACVSAEVHRRRAAVTALEDLQHAFDREARTDGPVYARGRTEGHADVAAKLREALPGAAEKLNLDGQLKLVADFKMRVAEVVDWARSTLTQPPSPEKDSAFVAGVNIDRLAELLRRSE